MERVILNVMRSHLVLFSANELFIIELLFTGLFLIKESGKWNPEIFFLYFCNLLFFKKIGQQNSHSIR